MWRLTDKGREVLLGDEKMDDAPTKAPEVQTYVAAVDEHALEQAHERAMEYAHRLEALLAENAELKKRLAEALASPVSGHKMETADMILALIDEGFVVRRA